MKIPYHLFAVASARLFGNRRQPHFAYAEVVRGRTWACTDLGAFPRPLPRLPGIEGVVVMEDRHPEFYLSFTDYRPRADAGLDRHGPLRNWTTQQDLKELVAALHTQQVKVAIGFWNYGGWWPFPKNRWLRAHPELRRVRGSSDLYPFVRLRREGVEYVDYIARQYARLSTAFGFDGLMLGDGFCGFGTIVDPDRYRDQEAAVPRWTRFYTRIAEAVHRSNGILLAYDRMGFSYREARKHGVDYHDLARAGLDILVYQSYPQAWGNFWLGAYRDRFDLASNVRNLATVKEALAGTHTQVFHTVELGDSVEKWVADPEKTFRLMAQLAPLAGGRFLVWANDVFARVSAPPVTGGCGSP